MSSTTPFTAQSPVSYLDQVSALESVKAYKKATWEQLKIKSGDWILDVGCGTGEDVIALARHIPRPGKIIGVDRDLVMVAEAWKRVSGQSLPVEFKVADVHKLDFEDNSFHACRSDRVFQHLEDPARALSEMVRVVRPQGRIVISDPDWSTLVIDGADSRVTRKIVCFICDRQIRNSDMGRRLRWLFRSSGLKNIFTSAGAIMLTDFRIADQVWSLNRNAAEALTAGIITEEEYLPWLKDISAAAESGNFLGVCTGFTASGTKEL